MSISSKLGSEETISSSPLWMTTVVYALLASVAVCYPAWPGQMGYDPLFAYRESISGIETMIWPPLHAYLFFLSRAVGAGAGGLFAAQTFILFFSVGLSVSLIVRRRAFAIAAMAGFAALFVIVSPVLGVAVSLWRDVPTGSFAMASLALWLLAAHRRSLSIMVASAVALGCCVALRYNAFPLFALTVPLMVWRPYLGQDAPNSARVVTAVALVVSIGLAGASARWRLPDLRPLPAPDNFTTTQMFDLLGVSACSGRSFVPLEVTSGWPLTPAQVRTVYDPRHVNLSFQKFPGIPQLRQDVASEPVQRMWREVIPKHLDCYLAHRTAVFVEQIGIAKAAVFYPAHGAIDPNEFGLKLAHPDASAKLTRYVVQSSVQLWRRPAMLYLGAALVVLLLCIKRRRYALLTLAVLGGALANFALLFLIGPAADARYAFPSSVLCAFLIAAGTAILADRGAPAHRSTVNP
jgi:hypothetical protein